MWLVSLVGGVKLQSIVKMADGGGGKVKTIQSDSEFQKELVLAAERLVVVDFFATW